MELEDVLDRLFNLFNTNSISELAKILNVSQPTISKWRARGSINPIKKICREMEIYDKIFGDLSNSQIYNFQESKNKITNGSSLVDNSNNKATLKLDKNVEYKNIPAKLLSELDILFSREELDEKTKQDFIYKFEDFIYELKKNLRK